MEVPVFPGDWTCSRPGCSFMNFAKRTVCRECGKAKNPGLYDGVCDVSENEDDECLQVEISPAEQNELFLILEEQREGGSKDNLEIVNDGNSDFTLEKDAMDATEGNIRKKRKFKKFQKQCKKQRIERLSYKKKKKEEEFKVAKSASTITTNNPTAEWIFSLLMDEIVAEIVGAVIEGESLRKADKDDISEYFSDISLD